MNIIKKIALSVIFLLMLVFLNNCSSSQSLILQNELLPQNIDERNERLSIVLRFETMRGSQLYFNDFQKKGNVCPLCQF
jgi:hypothetical protein